MVIFRMTNYLYIKEIMVNKLKCINLAIEGNNRYKSIAKTKLEEAILWLQMEQGTFNKSDLVSFGNYLLSKERKDCIISDDKAVVYDSDLSNWKELNK